MKNSDTDLLNFIMARSGRRWPSREAIRTEVDQMNADTAPPAQVDAEAEAPPQWECSDCGWYGSRYKTCPKCSNSDTYRWTYWEGN